MRLVKGLVLALFIVAIVANTKVKSVEASKDAYYLNADPKSVAAWKYIHEHPSEYEDRGEKDSR